MKRLDDTAAAEYREFAAFIGCFLLICALVVCGVRPDLVYAVVMGVFS